MYGCLPSILVLQLGTPQPIGPIRMWCRDSRGWQRPRLMRLSYARGKCSMSLRIGSMPWSTLPLAHSVIGRTSSVRNGLLCGCCCASFARRRATRFAAFGLSVERFVWRGTFRDVVQDRQNEYWLYRLWRVTLPMWLDNRESWASPVSTVISPRDSWFSPVCCFSNDVRSSLASLERIPIKYSDTPMH